MAKASKKSTSDVPALPAVPLSPEQEVEIEKARAFQREFARAIDDAIGIETGQRRPKWARPKRKPRIAAQNARVTEVLRELYPHGPVPVNVPPKVLRRDVCKRFEARGWEPLPSPSTVARARGRLR